MSESKPASIVIKYLASMDGTREKRILEVGSGDGRHLFALSKNTSDMLVGVEYSPGFIKDKSQKAVKFISADALNLPFGDNTFNVVFSNSFYEHVYDPAGALLEQSRVLRHGGKLIVITPNLLNPKSFYRFFFRYAMKSGFRHGWLKWLLAKGKVVDEPYREQYDFRTIKQKDEDIRSYFWWKRFLVKVLPADVRVEKLSTTRLHRLPRYLKLLLRPFWGGIFVVLSKN